MHWPGHAVVCSEHTEWSLCPKKMLVLKRPGRYRTVSQSDGGYEDRTEGDWGNGDGFGGKDVKHSGLEFRVRRVPPTLAGIYADEKPWGGCSRAAALHLPDAATL